VGVNSFFASLNYPTKNALRLLFKLGVIAASGRHVREGERLAGALAWQPCAGDVGTLWWGCQLAGAKCAITIGYKP